MVHMDEKNLQPNQPGVGKKLYRIVQAISRILASVFPKKSIADTPKFAVLNLERARVDG